MAITNSLEGFGKLMNAACGDQRSRALSVRLSEGEQARIREVARRLQVTESAVLRYAVRNTLKQLAPLDDPGAGGLSLLPVFVERGAELAASFDLDAARLDRILNHGPARADTTAGAQSAPKAVDRDDLALLAMAGLGDSRVLAKLREMRIEHVETQDSAGLIRGYFYRKYIYGTSPASDKRRGAAEAPDTDTGSQPLLFPERDQR